MKKNLQKFHRRKLEKEKSAKITQEDSRISRFFLNLSFSTFFSSKMSLLFQKAQKKLINQVTGSWRDIAKKFQFYFFNN
jgi:hypothetical protein